MQNDLPTIKHKKVREKRVSVFAIERQSGKMSGENSLTLGISLLSFIATFFTINFKLTLLGLVDDELTDLDDLDDRRGKRKKRPWPATRPRTPPTENHHLRPIFCALSTGKVFKMRISL